ncbi:MAG: tRNA (adenosine(37)-N6)-dimethylallyltransferase MiaA [Bacteroidetes bacterium]|nr:MAG: tRNA (adenosine(37)-N6)-dimethylallyltransferase MiaA [Bacteroidota bacterium]
MSTPNLLVILGATAMGKTRLAAYAAYQLGGEVLSADSRQVYKGLDIGTGKDYGDYTVQDFAVPYHLIDLMDAGKTYHVNQFKHDFFTAFKQLQQRSVMPILCGGSGLYIDAVLRNLAYTSIPNNFQLRASVAKLNHNELIAYFNTLPATEFTAKADLTSIKKTIRAIEICDYLNQYEFIPIEYPTLKPVIFGLHSTVEWRSQRILARLHHRLNNGLIEEVQGLLDKGIDAEQLIYYGLEYKFVTQHLLGVMSYQALEELLGRAIIQYAKRQMTYFRKMMRDGHRIHWIDATLSLENQFAEIKQHLHENK